MSRDAHYRKQTIQPIDVIESYKLSFILGNVIKYVLRHEAKNGREDLLKALWYLVYNLSGHAGLSDHVTQTVDQVGRYTNEVAADPEAKPKLRREVSTKPWDLNI